MKRLFKTLDIYHASFVMEDNKIKKMRKYDLDGDKANEFKDKLKALCSDYGIKADNVLIRENQEESNNVKI